MKALRLTLILTITEAGCEAEGSDMDRLREQMLTVTDRFIQDGVPAEHHLFSKVEEITLPDGEAEEGGNAS